jgi:hypothetical protein
MVSKKVTAVVPGVYWWWLSVTVLYSMGSTRVLRWKVNLCN